MTYALQRKPAFAAMRLRPERARCAPRVTRGATSAVPALRSRPG